jgi:predicted MFS family arabinose efflux permease
LHPIESAQADLSTLVERVTESAGGPARLRVVLLLAGVLAVQGANVGSVGALARQLEKAFGIGNTELGLLTTVTALVAAVACLPFGVLADRAKRVRLLWWGVLAGALCMVASGLAQGYAMLLATRFALGAAIAASAPIVTSLMGDLFPAQERSRIFGMVLTGELVGTGLGLVISAELGAIVGWRAPLLVLAVPNAVLALLLWRLLPEPARGGQSWLYPGAEEIKPAEEAEAEGPSPISQTVEGPGADDPSDTDAADVRRRARELKGVHANSKLVLRQDPARLSPRAAATYVLRIPSNLVLIGASALGYFFLAGLQAFAVLFAETHYGISQTLVVFVLAAAGIGGVAGTLYGGRLADSLVRKGVADARPMVAGIAFVCAAFAFLPGLISGNILLSLPFFAIAAGFVAAPDPPLDAARLDVVPSRLWGQAEAVRTFARNILQSFAPLLFGFISASFGGPHAGAAASTNPHLEAAAGRGLEYAFIIMLLPLLAAGVLLLLTRRTYLVDVATADVSERANADAKRSTARSEPSTAVGASKG